MLNIFTNCGDVAYKKFTILETYKSFVDTFGEQELTVYMDIHPNKWIAPAYAKRIKKHLGVDPIITNGLAEGYVRAIENAKDEYIFMLEHDWTFQNIDHSLDEIIDLMKKESLCYMKFNRFPNRHYEWLDKWETDMIPKDGYCLTDNISNNPHILNVQYYKDNVIKNIDKYAIKSFGIEQNLEKTFWGAVYGNIGHPATLNHIDGRHTNRAILARKARRRERLLSDRQE